MAVVGLISVITWVDDRLLQYLLVLVIAAIVILMVWLVGKNLLGKPGDVKERYPSHGERISQVARDGWYDGGDASVLEGAWEVRWYSIDEKGQRVPYMVKSKNGTYVEYPIEQARIKSKRAMISVENIDRTTGFVYFSEGRLSRKNTVTLTYWGPPGIKDSMLVGVLCLQLDAAFDETVMRGDWIGYGRKGSIKRGETVWKKIAKCG